MKQTTKTYTTLLEISGEGGSITINKKLFGDEYKYWFTTNEAAMADLLSAEEKLAIIQSEFERLYDSNHPVRNAIDTLDSIEEVRIIKEALK